MGIEPTRPAWKAGILPLNYTRNFLIAVLATSFSITNKRRSVNTFFYLFRSLFLGRMKGFFPLLLEEACAIRFPGCPPTGRGQLNKKYPLPLLSRAGLYAGKTQGMRFSRIPCGSHSPIRFHPILRCPLLPHGLRCSFSSICRYNSKWQKSGFPAPSRWHRNKRYNLCQTNWQ